MTKPRLDEIIRTQATRPSSHRPTAHRLDALELEHDPAVSSLTRPPHALNVRIDHAVAMNDSHAGVTEVSRPKAFKSAREVLIELARNRDCCSRVLDDLGLEAQVAYLDPGSIAIVAPVGEALDFRAGERRLVRVGVTGRPRNAGGRSGLPRSLRPASNFSRATCSSHPTRSMEMIWPSRPVGWQSRTLIGTNVRVRPLGSIATALPHSGCVKEASR